MVNCDGLHGIAQTMLTCRVGGSMRTPWTKGCSSAVTCASSAVDPSSSGSGEGASTGRAGAGPRRAGHRWVHQARSREPEGATAAEVLALAGGAAVPVDRVVDVLWGSDDPPQRPADQVGVLVSRLPGRGRGRPAGADRRRLRPSSSTGSTSTSLAARSAEAGAAWPTAATPKGRAAAEAAWPWPGAGTARRGQRLGRGRPGRSRPGGGQRRGGRRRRGPGR